MLHAFLTHHRAELLERCRGKVARRLAPRATPEELHHGLPIFLDQFIETLRITRGLPRGQPPRARDAKEPSAIVTSAIRHGRELLHHGFTIDQVVYDYGDLCQAVTELAAEVDAPFTSDDYQTLNRCLDDAIADAVGEFARQRHEELVAEENRAMTERLGALAHELRNHLNSAMLAFGVIKLGSVGVTGATAAVLDRSHAGLRRLIDSALIDVRLAAGLEPVLEDIALDRFIAEAQVAASLTSRTRGCEFLVEPVEAELWIRADRVLLHSAVSNLLQNAFKFTRDGTRVVLSARRSGRSVKIEVSDQCGGLPPDAAVVMFRKFGQMDTDRSGLGLGLSISRRAVEASGGTLTVRNIPGHGCVFTVELPLPLRVAGGTFRPEVALAP